MVELLVIYKLPLLAGVLAAATLGVLGCHLAARDRAMQTLCVAQGATLGILLGIGLLHQFTEIEASIHYSPVLLALAVASFVYYLSELLVKRKSSSRSSNFTALFVVLLSLSSMVSALFPALETHLAQVFFGDLATLSDRDGTVALGLFSIGLFLLLKQWRKFSSGSFDIAAYGFTLERQTLFNLFSLTVLCFSVQFLGFLFTVSCLFLPTSILGYSKKPGLTRHALLCALTGFLGCLLGFLSSLAFTRLPTVPAVVISMAAIGAILLLIEGGRVNQS